MHLIEIKNHIKQTKLASLNSLCVLFQCQPDTMRCMLSHLIGKGCIRQCTKTPACGDKCFKCPTASFELYEWVEA